jgi:hypothetical protein
MYLEIKTFITLDALEIDVTNGTALDPKFSVISSVFNFTLLVLEVDIK